MSGPVMRTPPAVDRPPQAGEDLILTLDVTSEHIRAGKPSICTECPIALALLSSCARAGISLGAGAPVVVQDDTCTVRLGDGDLYGGMLPARVIAFIEKFDRRELAQAAPFREHVHLRRFYPSPHSRMGSSYAQAIEILARMGQAGTS
jgi:hypothetical protein